MTYSNRTLNILHSKVYVTTADQNTMTLKFKDKINILHYKSNCEITVLSARYDEQSITNLILTNNTTNQFTRNFEETNLLSRYNLLSLSYISFSSIPPTLKKVNYMFVTRKYSCRRCYPYTELRNHNHIHTTLNKLLSRVLNH